jgi:hypothetical protein
MENKMQFLTLLTRHPDKVDAQVPPELRETEFETVRRYYYTDCFVQQIWLRSDAAGACMIVEAASIEEVAEKLNALPLARAGFLQTQLIAPLLPYSGFAPRA